jgi:hypothetical protein
MQKLVIEMFYLFEYDDNEEAMIYSIQIFEIGCLKKYNFTFYQRNIVRYVEEYVFARV